MASIIRLCERGIYSRIPLADGQIKHERVDTCTTKWTIAIYEGKDDLISITRNDKETRDYKVKIESGWAVRIRRTFIASDWGAKSLFNLFLGIDSYADYRFNYLDKIWEYTKPIKVWYASQV